MVDGRCPALVVDGRCPAPVLDGRCPAPMLDGRWFCDFVVNLPNFSFNDVFSSIICTFT